MHSTKKPVTTMLTYPWKCTVLHCNHLGNTWKPLVLMTRHFDYCLSASEGDNQSIRSSAPVVSRCFPGGYNVKLYISRGRLAWWLLAFLHSDMFILMVLHKKANVHVVASFKMHIFFLLLNTLSSQFGTNAVKCSNAWPELLFVDSIVTWESQCNHTDGKS